MLENLLNTKLKKKLLGIFFALPNRSFSSSELNQMTEASSAAVQQTLREFVKMQVVASAGKAERRCWRINHRFRLYDELWDLLRGGEYSNVQDEVVKILKRLPNVQLAILTGIFSLEPQISADLLLVGEQINRLRLEQILMDIQKWVGQEINFSLMSPEEYEYRQMMNDRFIRDILDHAHLVPINNLK